MITGSVSPLNGICIIRSDGGMRVIDLGSNKEIDRRVAHILISNSRDLYDLGGESEESLIQEAKGRVRVVRCVLNLESLMIRDLQKLHRDFAQESDRLIQAGASVSQIKSSMLRAPYKNPELLREASAFCNSFGFVTAGAVLDNVRELQPTLNSMWSMWTTMDSSSATTDMPLSYVWQLAADRNVLVEAVTASSSERFVEAWSKLALLIASAETRSTIAKCARLMARQIWPGRSDVSYIASNAEHSLDDTSSEDPQASVSIHKQYLHATNQIRAIEDAVSEGHDSKARLFLRELIQTQGSSSDGSGYLVKSLCNIASRCKDLLRTDFERICLDYARNILPYDRYTLVQLSDHFKRIGDFKSALSVLNDVSLADQDAVFHMLRADIHSQMGDKEEAFDIYDSIADIKYHSQVRCAKADILRKTGKLDLADSVYDELLVEGKGTHRVLAGKAEIAKLRGDLSRAEQLYTSALEDASGERVAPVVYKSALADVYVRAGRLREAFNAIDFVIQSQRFSRYAQMRRETIVALIGKSDIRVDEIPCLVTRQTFDEWSYEFLRGLLLMSQGRFESARNSLLVNFQQAGSAVDDTTSLRLGAAVWYLRSGAGVDHAAEVLDSLAVPTDAFANSVANAFRLHVATAKRDAFAARGLAAQLRNTRDRDFQGIVDAISQRNWRRVHSLEVRVLMRAGG